MSERQNMDSNILLDMQRKVIGGYMNAAEFGVYAEVDKITKEELVEELFDHHIHKAVVRAMNHLKAEGLEITDYSVLDFLQQHGLPKTIQDQDEYNILQSNFNITYKSFLQYVEAIAKYKLRGGR